MEFPDYFQQDIALAHLSWHVVLKQGLDAIEQQYPGYLSQLATTHFLPTQHRLFAAFSMPISEIRYVLIGEGPYPRDASATGYCFMDGAVAEIWSQEASAGLSKSVNRATSLRNFIKMLLVADGYLTLDDTSSRALTSFVQQMRQESDKYVQTMMQLQDNFLKHGFLMLNASLVFRSEVSPAEDAKVWRIFLQFVFEALAQQASVPSLILWGKIADRLESIDVLSQFEKIKSEHPYNLSFIGNLSMHKLFAPMKLLSTSM